MTFIWAVTKHVISGSQEGILGLMRTEPWLVSLLRSKLAHVLRAGPCVRGKLSTRSLLLTPEVEWSNLASENTECLVRFEFQINSG